MNSDYLLQSDSLTRDQLRKYNVSELQSILGRLNLATPGKKHELVERVYNFWLELQLPSEKTLSSPTTSVRFTLPTISDFQQFILQLQSFGSINALLVDPDENACYVVYKSIDSSKRFYESCGELNLECPRYVKIDDVEKRSQALQLISKNQQLNNVIQKKFNKTTTEPRVFWCTAPEAESK